MLTVKGFCTFFGHCLIVAFWRTVFCFVGATGNMVKSGVALLTN